MNKLEAHDKACAGEWRWRGSKPLINAADEEGGGSKGDDDLLAKGAWCFLVHGGGPLRGASRALLCECFLCSHFQRGSFHVSCLAVGVLPCLVLQATRCSAAWCAFTNTTTNQSGLGQCLELR